MPQILPAEYYDSFLSTEAKERKPAPSMFTSLVYHLTTGPQPFILFLQFAVSSHSKLHLE